MEATQQLLQQQMQQQQQQLQVMTEQMQKMMAEMQGQQMARQQERQEQERRLDEALTAADQRQARERTEFEQRMQELRAQLATASSSSGAAGTAAATDPLREAARIIDTRVIGRPDLWHGEKEKYPDWSFVFKGFMVAIDSRYQEIFERVENADAPVSNRDLDPANRHLSTQLYYILVMLSRDKAQDKIKKIAAGEGFEVWRNISLDYDPKVRTRRVALLIKVLTAKFGGDIGQALDQFEAMVKEYEQTSKKVVDDDLKVGVAIINMTDTDTQAHLVKNAHRLETWQAMRDELMDMTRTSEYINAQPKPMELGAIPQKGKGKGKKGKGKGEGDEDKWCDYCEKTSHDSSECWWNQTNWSNSQTSWWEPSEKKSSKDPSTKGGGKKGDGKGKNNMEKECFYCGKMGHVASKCKKKKADKDAREERAAAAAAAPLALTDAPGSGTYMTAMPQAVPVWEHEDPSRGFLLPMPLQMAEADASSVKVEQLKVNTRLAQEEMQTGCAPGLAHPGGSTGCAAEPAQPGGLDRSTAVAASLTAAHAIADEDASANADRVRMLPMSQGEGLDGSLAAGSRERELVTDEAAEHESACFVGRLTGDQIEPLLRDQPCGQQAEDELDDPILRPEPWALADDGEYLTLIRYERFML